MIPISRVEMYLAKICGEDVELPIPQTRKEVFLAIIAGESYEKPVPSSRVELYLAKILGDDVPLPIPQSREEIFLAAIAGVEYPLPYPESRIEYWLHKWATYEEWSTVTGNPVSFTAKAAPLRQLSVAFAPVQDLHGYDSPWPAGGGKNLLFLSEYSGNFYNAAVGTSLASTSANYKGTDTNSSPMRQTNVQGYGGAVYATGLLSAGAYYLSFRYGTTQASGRASAFVVSEDYTIIRRINNFLDVTDVSQSFTISEEDAGCRVAIIAGLNAAETYDVYDLECHAGSTALPSWTPYSNICPILGWDSLNVEQRGKNLLDPDTFDSYTAYTVNADGSITISAGNSSAWGSDVNKPVFLKAGTYTLSRTEASGRCAVRSSLNNYGSDIAAILPSAYNVTFTLTEDAFIKIKINTGASEYPVTSFFMLELGSTASAFVPYASRSISITLGQTIYSGTVDVVTGVGEIDRKSYQFDGTENWSYESAYSAFQIYGLITDARSMTSSAPNAICSSYIEARRMNASAANGSFVLNSDAHTANRLYIKNLAYDASTKSEFAASLIGQTIAYELATPLTIQLTPQEVESLAGDNTMWTDGDSLEVTYRSN